MCVMEQTNYNQKSFVVIRNEKELNSTGCQFFVEADNIAPPTLVSSNQLRWLTHKNNGENFFTKEQEEAIGRIVESQQRKDKVPPFSMNILLYSDPRKMSDEEARYIKALLQCVGVEVRYLKVKDERRTRIALKRNKLFISMSSGSEADEEVHEGFLYEANSEHDPLLGYFKSQFNHDYEIAKKLSLVKNKIVVNWMKWFKKWSKTSDGIKTIVEIIGIVVGLIGIILLVF